MDTLLQARIDDKALTDEEIREEVDTFTFAGHDTTASAMTFLLYNVAKYPDVQERLYEEITSQIGAEFCDLSMSALNDLQYMDRVIKESLRLYPPVPVVARTATNDMLLLGQHLKRGTTVALNIFSMHRNEEYFPDPCRFSPERFEGDDDYLIYDRYAYIPFSTGPRYCIGKKFAQYELKSTLVKVLQRFQLRLTSVDYVPTLKAEIVLKPVEGMQLIFKRRK
ncbi:AGAP002416-PA-like protein [Anopheles sinensis]|uniref:AGAP002416-PA-like protein n=1 Tax=Anopheles sinensis TaxID=74873 RepID=A0A084VSE8_ANOSI|nr:AGAP002416-PA-like protein [Anopheles sinensis]